MTKEEVDREILNPALEKGLKRDQIESILDETAHLPDFIVAFSQKVLEFEEKEQIKKTTVQVGSNTKLNWNNILLDMKKNACGYYVTSTKWHDKPREIGKVENCKVERLDGDLDRFSKEMMRLEENEKIIGHLNESDELLNKRFNLARVYQQEVEKYIMDNDFQLA